MKVSLKQKARDRRIAALKALAKRRPFDANANAPHASAPASTPSETNNVLVAFDQHGPIAKAA